MESISDTLWDVVICGTGLQPSLLALALSRSGKNILHVDPNAYYGGAEAALNLADVDEWAAARSDVVVTRAAPAGASTATPTTALARPSAYWIPLAPQFLHARCELVNLLVSSRAFRQLEFQAVSSFFILELSPSQQQSQDPHLLPFLARIPATREDVFASTAMAARAKRQLMKFLKFVLSYNDGVAGEGEGECVGSSSSSGPSWQAHASEPFGGFLQASFGLDDRMRDNVLSLTLSLDGGRVTVAEGLARLHQHITSMGVFGPGFAAVYPKWGGCGEIVQVACRAAAVGGAVYMLGSNIRSAKTVGADESREGDEQSLLEVELTQDMTVKTKYLVLGSTVAKTASSQSEPGTSTKDGPQPLVSRLVAIVGSPLSSLFAPTVEGAPIAGGAVIALPAGRPVLADGTASDHPVFVVVHSSDTGECPPDQSVLHLTTIRTANSKAVLEGTLDAVLVALGNKQASDDGAGIANGSELKHGPTTAVVPCLYTLYYEQPRDGGEQTDAGSAATVMAEWPETTIRLPPLPVDVAMQDAPLAAVRRAWEHVMGPEADEDTYMRFEDREGMGTDEDDE